MKLDGFNLGVCMCGSFCTYSAVLDMIKELKKNGMELYPIISEASQKTVNRFGSGEGFMLTLRDICGREPITTIEGAEPIGPEKKLDAMLVAPCTGNTLAKLNNGICDSVVTMACKAHLRNDKPLILAPASNDALGANLQNIGGLMVRKNIYFVPFGQDDCIKKPMSMIAHFDYVLPAIEAACDGKQLQPVLM